MQISGWSIDGFGVFAGSEVRDVPGGLVVFHGPNEAGKSTLMAFIRGMLFGFPTGNVRELKYSPMRGGRHGGRLFLVGNGGEEIVIERQASPRPTLRITCGGEEKSEEFLKQQLGNCDKALFRSVFGFSLAELQELDGLSQPGLRDRIFTAGVSGAGRSWADVLKELETKKDALLKQRGGKSRINDFAKSMGNLEAGAREKRADSLHYQQALQSIQKADQKIERYQVEIESARRTLDRSTSLKTLWPTWSDRVAAERDLTQLQLDDRYPPLQPDIAALNSGLVLYQEWVGRRIETDGKRAFAQTALSEKLRDLGANWDRELLVSFDRSIPQREIVRSHEDALFEAVSALRDAERIVLDREAELARAQAARENAQAGLDALEIPPAIEQIAEMGIQVRRLRANLAEQVAANFAQQTAATTLATLTQSRNQAEEDLISKMSTAGIALIAVAVAALSVALWWFVGGNELAIAAMAVCVVFAVAAAWEVMQVRTRRTAQRRALDEKSLLATNAQREHEEKSRLANSLENAIATDAEKLGLPRAVTNHDVENETFRLQGLTNKRAEHDAAVKLRADETRKLADLEIMVKSANDQLVAKRTERDDRVLAWEEWKRDAGVPSELSPDGVKNFFDTVQSARDHLRSVEDAERNLQRLGEQISTYEKQIDQISRAVEFDLAAGESVEIHVGELRKRAGSDQETRQRAETLCQKIEQCERLVEQRLGAGSRASDMGAELVTGDLERWGSEIEGASEAIATLGAMRDEAIRERQDVDRVRQDLEGSTSLPDLELQIGAQAQELAVAVREWRKLALAETLIKDALQRFERERQPAVLQSASTLFAEVTGGRYQRVYRPLQESSTLSIVGQDETTCKPEELSRGTMEQLYLCVRLGLAESLTDHMGLLPLLTDDVLVNFDPERAFGIAQALSRFAATHQILFFTCHPETAKMMREINPASRQFEMQRFGSGGDWIPTA